MRIGLTGSSGVGKGTVAQIFCAHGATHIDADAVYRQILASSTALLDALCDAFGDVRAHGGGLDRPKLAAVVFADADKLALLNRITVPHIRAAMLEQAACFPPNHIILYDAPTLFQTGGQVDCDCTVGILADRTVRLERIIQRDGLTESQAMARIDAQPEDAYFIQRCDHILYNNGDLKALHSAVHTLYQRIKEEFP